jgi:uncharacterized protein YdaU (DUF1376 family)
MKWYAHHIGDYATATMGLSITQDGIYRRLLDVYYATERALPTDVEQVFNMCRAFAPHEQEACKFVLNRYFRVTDHGYVNDRAQSEIEKSNYVKEKRRIAGIASGVSRGTHVGTQDKQVLNTCSTNGGTNGQQPTTTTKERTTPSSTGVDWFEKFWSAWPRGKRKVAKEACQAKWKSRRLEAEGERICLHVEAMKETKQWLDGYEPSPLVYLNQGRYKDELPPPDVDDFDDDMDAKMRRAM